jgi:hypothetical protein
MCRCCHNNRWLHVVQIGIATLYQPTTGMSTNIIIISIIIVCQRLSLAVLVAFPALSLVVMRLIPNCSATPMAWPRQPMTSLSV